MPTLAQGVLERFRACLAWIRGTPAFSTQSYWETRHQRHAGTLAAVGHVQLSDQANAEQYAIKRDRLAGAIRRHVPDGRGRSLLDAGCGVGALTSLYVELGFDVTGVDFSATAIATARESGINANFVQSSLDGLSLPRSFDVVCLIDVLQHLVNDGAARQAVASVGRHVHRDGLALVMDSMADEAPSALHCRRRSLDWHLATFDAAGYDLIDLETFVLPHERSTKNLLVLRRRK